MAVTVILKVIDATSTDGSPLTMTFPRAVDVAVRAGYIDLLSKEEEKSSIAGVTFLNKVAGFMFSEIIGWEIKE